MNAEDDIVKRIWELTRRLDGAVDEQTKETIKQQRTRLLESASLQARVRSDPDGEVLVLYPEDWIEDDGTVDPDRITDPDEAIELPLDPEQQEDDWAEIHEHNRRVASAVTSRYGPVHGETARALATYLSNHHLRRIEAASEEELETFREDYFIRNSWPDEEQVSLVDRSIAITQQIARELSGVENQLFDLED